MYGTKVIIPNNIKRFAKQEYGEPNPVYMHRRIHLNMFLIIILFRIKCGNQVR